MMFGRNSGKLIQLGALAVVCPLVCAAGPQPLAENISIHLRVDAGTPLRLYITKRASYRQGEPVQAKFAEPVWAFDRIVIPAGTAVDGRIVQLEPVSKMARAMAIVRGDFTPLKQAEVSFTRMILSDGRSVVLDVQPSFGLASIYDPAMAARNSKQKRPARNPDTRSAHLWSLAKRQAHAQANARTRGLLDFVRGPNKREWLEDFLWAKLPYHPQRYRTGNRFDAVLEKPIDFGEVSVAAANLREVGSQPAPGAPALVRFLSTISSADAHAGEAIAGVLSQPLLSADHRVVLPEGTRLTGKITLARPARMFHRGGQLRFAFGEVEPPAFASAPAPRPEPAQAQLTAAEPKGSSVSIDEEGTARATESKARFLRPVIAGLVAAKSMDNDAGKQNASGGAEANYGGRGLGGFSGFGLFGTAAAMGPPPVGAALGFYGLGWSAYSTIVSRGREVIFDKNSAIAIRFGAPPRNR
jgi:hypothetical protein